MTEPEYQAEREREIGKGRGMWKLVCDPGRRHPRE